MAELTLAKVTLADMLGAVAQGGISSVEISPEWFNGRAAYGGLVASLAATSLAGSLAEPKPIRSLMVNFVGPVPPQSVTIEPKILRTGKSVTQGIVDVSYNAEVLTHASAAFGIARPALAALSDVPFTAAARHTVPMMDPGGSLLPSFLKNFEMHWMGGSVPMSGRKDRAFGMWVRHRHNVDAFPLAKIIAAADVPPPIMMSHYTHRVRASSLSWSLEFVRPVEEVQTDWFYLDFVLEAASGGYSQQSGRIFDEEGVLCAITRQCMVYFE